MRDKVTTTEIVVYSNRITCGRCQPAVNEDGRTQYMFGGRCMQCTVNSVVSIIHSHHIWLAYHFTNTAFYNGITVVQIAKEN